MFPYFEQPVIHIAGHTIYAFGICVALAVAVGCYLTLWRTRRLGADPRASASFLFWVLFSGFLLSHLQALALAEPQLFLRPQSLWEQPARWLNLWNGMASFGGILGGVLGGWLYVRRRRWTSQELWTHLDALAFAFPFGWAIARFGCYLAHDHPGVHTSTWFGVQYPGGARFDLGLMDCLFSLVAACAFLLLSRRKRPLGFYFTTFLLAYGGARLLLDNLRIEGRTLGLTAGQFGALLTILLAVVAVWRVRRFTAGSAPTPSHLTARQFASFSAAQRMFGIVAVSVVVLFSSGQGQPGCGSGGCGPGLGILPDGFVGQNQYQALLVTSPTPGAVQSTAQLPPGLSVVEGPASQGAIPINLEGTPGMAGTFNFTVTFIQGVTRDFQITIHPGLELEPNPATVQQGQMIQFMAFELLDVNGTRGIQVTSQVQWSSSNTAIATIVAGGANAGNATGVMASQTPVTITAQKTTTMAHATASLTVTAPNAPPPTISSSPVTDGTTRLLYNITFTCLDGNGGNACTINVPAGNLGAGACVDFSGTAAANTFTVSGVPTAETVCTVPVVATALNQTTTQNFTFNIFNPVSILDTDLQFFVNNSNTYALNITGGGNSPATCVDIGQQTQVTVSSNCQVSGTPQPGTGGTSSVTVQATKPTNPPRSTTQIITVHSAEVQGPTTLPDGIVGQPYPSQQLVVVGLNASILWSAFSGEGFTITGPLNQPLTFLGGTPNKAGTHNITVLASLDPNLPASATFQVTVHPALRIRPPSSSITEGTMAQLEADFLFDLLGGNFGLATDSVNWSSADPTKVDVSNAPGSKGQITGLMVTSTPVIITATSQAGATATAQVVVTTPTTPPDLTVTGQCLDCPAEAGGITTAAFTVSTAGADALGASFSCNGGSDISNIQISGGASCNGASCPNEDILLTAPRTFTATFTALRSGIGQTEQLLCISTHGQAINLGDDSASIFADIEGLTIAPTNPTINLNTDPPTRAFSAFYGTPLGNTDVTFDTMTMWSSSNTSVATILTGGVPNSGQATATGVGGSTTISASFTTPSGGQVTNSTTLTVIAATPAGPTCILIADQGGTLFSFSRDPIADELINPSSAPFPLPGIVSMTELPGTNLMVAASAGPPPGALFVVRIAPNCQAAGLEAFTQTGVVFPEDAQGFNGGAAYVANVGNDTISHYSIANTTPATIGHINSYPLPAGSGPRKIGRPEDEVRPLVILANELRELPRDNQSGALTTPGDLVLNGDLSQLDVSLNGRVFAATDKGPNVLGLHICNRTSGTPMTAADCVTVTNTGSDPCSVAVFQDPNDPDNYQVVVADMIDDNIQTINYRRSTRTFTRLLNFTPFPNLFRAVKIASSGVVYVAMDPNGLGGSASIGGVKIDLSTGQVVKVLQSALLSTQFLGAVMRQTLP